MTVVPFERFRQKQEEREDSDCPVFLRLRVDKVTGDLTIEKHIRSAVVETYVLDNAAADSLPGSLSRELSKWKWDRYYEAHPKQKAEQEAWEAERAGRHREPKWENCRMSRSFGTSGCRRRLGHQGPHHDARGDFEMACPHNWTSNRQVTTPAGFCRQTVCRCGHIVAQSETTPMGPRPA